MSKFIFIIVVILFGSELQAQHLLANKSSTYFSGVSSWASGKYKSSLQKSEVGTSDFGVLIGHVVNLKKTVDFPLFIGGEFGYQNMGADQVNAQVNGEFRTSNSTYWLNAVARYRPVFWSSAINPFLDVSAGPKVVSTGIFEQLTAEDYTRLDGQTRAVFNTTIGAGLGIKLPTLQDRDIYFDIGVYFQQTGATKVIERNSVLLDTDGQIAYRQQVTPLSNAQLRFGVTWFR